MQYLRLLSVTFLSTLVITGCHHTPELAAPPPQAQAPIVTTLPPIPPLAFPDVQIEKPKPKPPVVQAVVVPPPPKKHIGRIYHHRVVHKPETDIAANETPSPAAQPVGTPSAAAVPAGTAQPADTATEPSSAATVLGQLSADDATVNPNQNRQTEDLIERTEVRLKRLSRSQQARHKEAILQVDSFLTQARQAFAMNDLVGASTLANKAKILLDELLK
jgi:hypothetical protein